MPVYDYKCSEHGVFSELAMISESAKPCECPECGLLCPRVVMIPPEVLDMSPARRNAKAANEESRHSPIISSVDSREEAAARKQFYANKGKSCGCGSSHKSNHEIQPEQSALKQQVIFLPDGSKVFPSQRPWMISH